MRPTLSSCSTAACASWSAAEITASSRGTPSTSAVSRRPGVDHDQHLLAPLVLVLPGDRLAPPGGGLPVDDAGLVARHPLAQPLEQPALARAADARSPASRRRSAWSGSARRRGVGHAGIHRRRPRQRPASPAAMRSPSGPERADGDRAAGALPPADRGELEPLVEPFARRHRQLPRGRHRRRRAARAAARDLEREPPASPVRASDSGPRRPARAQTRAAPRARSPACAAPGARAASSRKAASQARSSGGQQPGGRRPHRARAAPRAPARPRPTSHGAGRDHDHRGASIFSMTPRSAVSAVTPSSSSSGATAIRCRSTAGASAFTSSGTTYGAPVEQRRRLRHLEQRHAAARRRAEREHRRVARGAHDRRDVRRPGSARPAPDARRRAAAPRSARVGHAARCRSWPGRSASKPPSTRVEDALLHPLLGIADEHLHQEPVELRLGQRVRALELDRVLRREHREGLRQRVGRAVDRHPPLLHRLEQRRLRLGGRAVDLVAEHQVAEDRPRPEGERVPGVVEQAHAGDVRGHEVGRELDAAELEPERQAERADEQRLRRARHALRAARGRGRGGRRRTRGSRRAGRAPRLRAPRRAGARRRRATPPPRDGAGSDRGHVGLSSSQSVSTASVADNTSCALADRRVMVVSVSSAVRPRGVRTDGLMPSSQATDLAACRVPGAPRAGAEGPAR